jgi:hypothetical protein
VWLPGRSAEVTDPLLALIAGFLLALLGQPSESTIRLPSLR